MDGGRVALDERYGRPAMCPAQGSVRHPAAGLRRRPDHSLNNSARAWSMQSTGRDAHKSSGSWFSQPKAVCSLPADDGWQPMLLDQPGGARGVRQAQRVVDGFGD